MARKSPASLLNLPFDCLLLVSPSIALLEEQAAELEQSGVPPLNIGRELSTRLLDVPRPRWAGSARDWFLASVAACASPPLLCTSPDLLFHPALDLDPLALFRQAARIHQLIVLWPGELSGNVLSYAVPEHHHYRTWQLSEELLRHPSIMIEPVSA